MADSIRIEKVRFEDILPIWQEHLWPDRTSPIEKLSAIDRNGSINPALLKERMSFWRAVNSNNQVVGVIGGQTTGDSYRSRGLWVNDQFRGKGIGRKLVRAVIQAASEEGRRIVWTMPRASSIDFYKKAGFQVTNDHLEGYEYGPHYLAEYQIPRDSSQEHDVNVRRLQLYSQLFLYGDFMPMQFWIDPKKTAEALKQFDSNWVPYNIARGDTGRMGLSVTSLDGGMTGQPDLQSLYQYSKETGHLVSENDFDTPTPVCEKVETIKPILSHFTGGLGRSRFVKFRAGGHFPPHRDQSVSFQVPDYFRIFVPLSNTGENQLAFTYDGRLMNYEPGRCYLFNALKVHSVFSFCDNAITLALSLKLTQKNVALAIRSLLVK